MSEPKSLDDFISELVATPREEFVPFALYNRDGDAIEFYLQRCRMFIVERVDEKISMLLNEDDRTDIVGVVLKNVTRTLPPGLKRAFLVTSPSCAWIDLNFSTGVEGAALHKRILLVRNGPPANSRLGKPTVVAEDLNVEELELRGLEALSC